MPGSQRLGLEGFDELVPGELAALEPGPRVGVGVGRVEGADEVLWQAGLGFVDREAVEGAVEDDATEIEEHGAHLAPGPHLLSCGVIVQRAQCLSCNLG